MLRHFVVAVLASVATALIFWGLNKIGNIPAILTVPTGAVVTFDLNQCPEGWEEYKAAYGRFVRGIDKSGSNVDPDGTRTPGSQQEDQFESHSHKHSPREGGTVWLEENYDEGGNWPDQKNGNTQDNETSTEGGVETRPKNVALLYCEKQ